MTAVLGIPQPGVLGDPAGGLIRSVSPGGQAWRSGIREGQSVIEVNAGETPLDWVLHTRSSGADYYLTMRGATAELRGTIPLAMIALLVALVAAAAASRRPRAAAATASLAAKHTE